MAKIDENKQYKFSEIIAMLENKELPKNTNIRCENKRFNADTNTFGKLGLVDAASKFIIEATISIIDINALWTIELPKADKFYLKLPSGFEFKDRYLNISLDSCIYFFSDEDEEVNGYQTQFTQQEIDAMPFDTNFFEQIKVDD